MYRVILSKKFFVLILFISVSACQSTDGPVDSDEIKITINSINQSDINSGIIEKDENISNNTGNPWGEFIKDSQVICENDPKGFEITSLSIQFAPKDGVNSMEEVFDEIVSIDFISTQGSDSDAERVSIGTINQPRGLGPLELKNLATRDDLRALYERLLGGDFHVGLKASTILTKDDSFSFDVTLRFHTRAFCE